MNYSEIRKQLIWNVRLDFDPVGIKYVFDENEIKNLPVTHRIKPKVTYCQYLAAARQSRAALFMPPEKLIWQIRIRTGSAFW